MREALPLLRQDGLDSDVYYVASAELFDWLPRDEQARILPPETARAAIGISGFTLPTLYRWVCSEAGRQASLYPFKHGHFLGSGTAAAVLAEAGLDGSSQAQAVRRFVARKQAAGMTAVVQQGD